MKNNNDKSVFDFWLLYEKVVGTLPEKTMENKEFDQLKQSINDGTMTEVSYSAVILPFSNKKKQEESLRNMVEILMITGKTEEFDYDIYYQQYIEKQKQENKELPLTDFVQILIDNNKIPAIDYKEYEEKVLKNRVVTNKIRDNINALRHNENQDNNEKVQTISIKKTM